MANGKFSVGKPSGGVTTVTVADGATNTNLVLPESGTVASVDTAVTDNAIARFDGTTGKLQDSGVIINDTNYLTITDGGIRLGYSTSSALLSALIKSDSDDLIATIGRYNFAGSDRAVLNFYADPVANTVTLDATGSNSSNLVIKNGNVENCRFTTSGSLVLTSGTGGLVLPNSAIADTNTLDWYEEGTFTPTIRGSTIAGSPSYTIQIGKYTRIGNLVSFNLYVDGSIAGATGNLNIGGLPFSAKSTESYHSVTVSFANNLSYSGSSIGSVIAAAANYIYFYTWNSAGTVSVVPVDSAFGIMLSGSYKV